MRPPLRRVAGRAWCGDRSAVLEQPVRAVWPATSELRSAHAQAHGQPILAAARQGASAALHAAYATLDARAVTERHSDALSRV
jgi:hypothetical protein